MADVTIPELSTTLTSVDRAADLFEVSDTSDSGNSKKTTVDYMLDLTSHPLGLTDVQSPTNKTFDNTNTVTLKDTLFTLQDDGDVTKQAKFQLSGITTGTTRTYTLPNASSTLVDLSTAQTLTNKTITSPTITTPTINNPTLNTDTVNEFTAAAGVTIDGVLLKDSKVNGSYITDSTVGNTQLALGVSVQTVYTSASAVATGTTVIPVDDTIPQNTEGDQYMTLAITPKSTTNILIIRVVAMLANSAASPYIVGALFQDTTANALAADLERAANASDPITFVLEYQMVAGTTSATTFKFRAGASGAGTTTFNGQVAGRFFGAIAKSSMVITEYKAA